MKTRTNISNVRVWVVRLFLTVLLIFTTATILRSVTVSDLSGQHKNSQVKAPSGPSGNFGLLPDGPPVPQRAAISAMRGHHWIIENNRIEWCNAEGIDLGSQDFAADRSSRGEGHIVRNNIIRNIGVCGIAGPGPFMPDQTQKLSK